MTPENLASLQRFIGMNLATLGMNALGAIVILLAGWWAAQRMAKVTGFVMRRSPGIDDTLKPLVVSVVKNTVRLLTVVAALGNFGVETSSLIAVFGAAGLAVGLALQGTLTNVAAGVMLLVLRPFQLGDSILVQGHSGTVQRIGLFATELTTTENLYVSLPNASVWGAPIVNYSRNPTRRIDVVVNLDYASDLDQAILIATAALRSDPRVHAEPAPVVAVRALGPASVELVLRGFVDQAEHQVVLYAVQKSAKERLQAAGILLAVLAPTPVYPSLNPAQ